MTYDHDVTCVPLYDRKVLRLSTIIKIFSVLYQVHSNTGTIISSQKYQVTDIDFFIDCEVEISKGSTALNCPLLAYCWVSAGRFDVNVVLVPKTSVPID